MCVAYFDQRGCFVRLLLVKIICQSFPVTNGKNYKKAQKNKENAHIKGGLLVFRCYSSMLVDTQTLVNSSGKFAFWMNSPKMYLAHIQCFICTPSWHTKHLFEGQNAQKVWKLFGRGWVEKPCTTCAWKFVVRLLI